MPDSIPASPKEERALQDVGARCGDVDAATLRLYRAAHRADQEVDNLTDEIERLQKLHYEERQRLNGEPVEKPKGSMLLPVKLHVIQS